MTSKVEVTRLPDRRFAGAVALVALIVALASAPAGAANVEKGKLSVSWDNTLSWGANWRVEGQDPSIIGIRNGGTAFSVNGDDGNLNFARGTLVSGVGKLTSEFDANYAGHFGIFARAFAFADRTIENSNLERTELSRAARNRVGKRAEFRDFFVWTKFDAWKVPIEVRVGDQVINWGESTFIQGGINAINPVDVSALRVPGAELRDGLLPVGAVLLSVRPHPNLGVSAFWQYNWARTQIDPPGSYFSSTDIVGEGASRVMLGFGSVPDSIPIGPSPTNPIGAVVPRGGDVNPADGGQGGAAIRWFVPALGGSEFGFYYIKYHSRLPVIMARTGSLAAVFPPTLNYASSARYFIEYPEDLKLYGLSWNALLGRTGIALQGEISHRKDVPFQVDDVELLYASLTPLRLIPALPAPDPFTPVRNAGAFLAANNQIGAFGFGETIPGFVRLDATQLQTTATKVFGRFLGSDQFVLVGEAAVLKVDNMPDKAEFRLEGPGTYTSGNAIHQTAGFQPGTEPLAAFPDDVSWGYVLAGRFDYNQAIGALNLAPRFSFAHDVSGVSPGPGGNFIEGRKALTVGVGANYLISWEFDLSYTRLMGAGRYNLLNDRDFIAAIAKYSF